MLPAKAWKTDAIADSLCCAFPSPTEESEMTKKLVALLLANIFLQAGAFSLTKVAAINSEDYISLFFNIFYALALTFIAAQAVIWQLILRKVELSRVYPVNALVPVLVLLIGVLFFKESLSINNIFGMTLLTTGLLLLVTEPI